jgi:hypothetical protein
MHRPNIDTSTLILRKFVRMLDQESAKVRFCWEAVFIPFSIRPALRSRMRPKLSKADCPFCAFLEAGSYQMATTKREGNYSCWRR